MLNDIHTKTPSLHGLCLGLLFCGGIFPAVADDLSPAPAPGTLVTAPAADPTHADAWAKVMQLGNIQVQGDHMETSRRIVAGLKVIKLALKTNLTNDPSHADDIVCRMNYDTGSHLIVHLRCATNKTLMLDRDTRATTILSNGLGTPSGSEEQALEHIESIAPPDRYFSTKVNASELQKLLLLVQCDGCSNSGLVVGNN